MKKHGYKTDKDINEEDVGMDDDDKEEMQNNDDWDI